MNPACFFTNDRGVALLLVLWVVTLLAIICAEFSWTMRTETAIATNYRESEQAGYTAEAGINRAIIELMRERKSRRSVFGGDETTSGQDTEEPSQDFECWEPGGRPYRFDFAGGHCEVVIEDESNKIGLNAFLKKAEKNSGLLKALLQEKVGLEGEARDIVADSLIDWYDADHNVTGVNGAEDDYYEGLEEPYVCRDGEIPAVEELLLVRGVDEKIFYGSARSPAQALQLTREELDRLLSGGGGPAALDEAEEVESVSGDDEETGPVLGLAELFSVTSTATTFKVNVNTATPAQLLLLEGMDAATARQIIAEREVQPFESPTDRLPQYANWEVWKDTITCGSRISVGVYRVRATGFSPDGRVARTISCVLRLVGRRCIVTHWQATD